VTLTETGPDRHGQESSPDRQCVRVRNTTQDSRLRNRQRTGKRSLKLVKIAMRMKPGSTSGTSHSRAATVCNTNGAARMNPPDSCSVSLPTSCPVLVTSSFQLTLVSPRPWSSRAVCNGQVAGVTTMIVRWACRPLEAPFLREDAIEGGRKCVDMMCAAEARKSRS